MIDSKVVKKSSCNNVVWVCQLELIPAYVDSLNLLLVTSFLICKVFLQRLWFSKETSSLDVCLMPKEKSWEWTHKVLTFHLVLVIDQSILPSHKHDMLNMLKRLHMHLVTWAKKKKKRLDINMSITHVPINSGITSFKNRWDKIMKQNTGISKTKTYNCKLLQST